MQEVCRFKINGKIYTIYIVNRIKGKKSYVGQSRYDEGDIFIEASGEREMLITLKHELMHVWLYENGHKNQNGEEVFDYEDLCELSALSNDSINRIVNLYLDNRGKI
jgi:hypothetical protein